MIRRAGVHTRNGVVVKSMWQAHGELRQFFQKPDVPNICSVLPSRSLASTDAEKSRLIEHLDPVATLSLLRHFFGPLGSLHHYILAITTFGPPREHYSACIFILNRKLSGIQGDRSSYPHPSTIHPSHRPLSALPNQSILVAQGTPYCTLEGS